MNMRTIRSIISFFLLAVSPSWVSGGAPSSDPKYEQFKHDMLPKVGHKIEFVGSVSQGKFGVRVTPDHWVGVEVESRSTNSSDLAKLNQLDHLQGHTVKLEGVLHFTEGEPGPKLHGVQSAGITEHFFFDVADTSFSETKGRPNEKSKPR